MSEGSRITEPRISARRAATLLSARVVTPAVTLAVYAMVARLGGPGDLGLYYYAYNVLTVFQILANFGYDSFLMREVAKTPERARTLLANSILILLPYGLLLAVAMPLAARVLGYDDAVSRPLVPGAAAVPLLAVAYALEAVLIGQERFRAILAGSILDGAVRLGVSYWALQGGHGTGALLLAVAGARAAACAFYLACLSRTPGLWPLHADRRVASELLMGARAFFLMYVNYAIATRLDGLLLARFASPEDGDAYSIPNRLTLAIWLVAGSVVGSVYPAMARAAGSAALGTMVTRTIRLLLIGSIPAAALLSLFPRPIVHLIAGPLHADAGAALLAIVVWAILPMSGNEPLLRGLLASGGQRAAFRNSCVLLGATAAGMSYAVLAHGARGAAFCLPCLLALDGVLNALALSRRTDLAALPGTILRLAVSLAASLGVLVLLRPALGMAAAIPFLAAYVAALLATGTVRLAELRDPRLMMKFEAR